MTTVSVTEILSLVYGPTGLPFTAKVTEAGSGNHIATGFEGSFQPANEKSIYGTKLYGYNALGRPVFLPATLDGKELPNPVIIMSGEKEIVETDVIDAGTVFEKVFMKPYDITIICTLISEDGSWPEKDIIDFKKLYTEGDLYTLECAYSNIWLQPKNNFLLTAVNLVDMAACENAQVIELTGRSNIDFELEIL